MNNLNIEEIYRIPNKNKEFFNNYDSNIPMVLYGCGNRCNDAIEMFKANGIIPVAICDSNSCKQGTIYKKIPVMSIEKIKSLYKDFFVFISAPLYFREIEQYLKDIIREDRICFFGNFQEQKEHYDFIKNNEEFILNFYNQLADEKSQKTLVNMLSGWVTCDNNYFDEVFVENQYFQASIINLSDNEIFVDAGAFTGDTIIKFVEKVKGNYKKIYAFEPNEICFEKLENVAKKYDNVVIVKKGAYEYKDTLSFYNTTNISVNERAHITNKYTGTCTIDVDSIDNQVTDNVTFIKMDIEGSELSALKGAEKTIIKNKPKLAICVYHKYQDIVEIPKYLTSLGLDYKYYLRHHSSYESETVLYAV